MPKASAPRAAAGAPVADRPPDAPAAAGPRAARDRILAAAVFVVAVLLRIPHLGWGLPEIEEEALPMKKAFEMWGWDTGRVTLNPQTVGWPSLSFYVHLLLQHGYVLVCRAAGVFHNRYDYYVQFLVDSDHVVLVSRAVSVLAAAGVAVAGYRVARRLAGTFAGLLAGTLLAICPMLVEHGQQITPDILLVFFSAMAVDRLLDILERGRTRDYVWAAVWIALGAACKYTPVLMTPVLYIAHLMRRRREGGSLALLGLRDRRLGWAALACILVFCAATPYLFADLHVLKRDFAFQAAHMSQGHFGQEMQSRSGHWYYLSRVLAPGMGLPALILGTIGLGWAAFRRRGGWAIVALTALVYFVVLGSFSTRFDRYMLPALQPLAVGTAGLWQMLRGRVARRAILARSAAAALALGVCVPALALTWQYHRRVGAPSTQWQARRFITEQLPRDRNFFAAELYTVQLPSTEVREQLKASRVFQRLDEQQRARLLSMPVYEYTFIPMYSTRVELSAFYYDLRHFEVYDYLLTSGAVRRRYEASPSRYPQQCGFYKDLQTYAVLEQRFVPSAHVRGPEIECYRLTDEGKQRLLADRGPLQPNWYVPYLDRLHSPHFDAFLESVGGDAYVRERYDLAQLFYQTLLDVAKPNERPRWLFKAAYSHMRNGDLEVAKQEFEEQLRDNPNDSSALADLGLVCERMGDTARARSLYQQLIATDRNPELTEWARHQLDALGAP